MSGAKAIQHDLATYPLNIPSKTLLAVASSVANAIGGTSGVLYTIFFTAAGATMATYDHGQELVQTNKASAWVESFASGVVAIQKYGGATEGSRTMLDAMLPALRTAQQTNWSTQLDGVAAVAKAASAGADATKRIAAHDAFGRTSYVGEEAVKNIPDPGAMAVAVWIQALVPHLQTE
ncbi:hypothetical protein H257_12630 [Aphanomyces astaci]|uniref:DhaL domain-containing protein n=1 Tax=Aphanomyces astaci TaxID=112090 RepID=W4FYH5_APHAT|nr:hypothetical protein H257_12630 [Aphanomyces astaci]ETV72540.1 hypothetical protein H257_12630 [Aphanomyces astaci]|eukprot:XP_009838222.1 hypothetical protein H257_12630 [Aphanomyces astaci]